jgi:hypothetical protein
LGTARRRIGQTLPWAAAAPQRPVSGGFLGESRGFSCIDAFSDSFYIRIVPAKKVQVGQVWKKEASGESFLVTKVYSEALATFAVLRKTGAEGEPPVRIRVSNAGPTQTLVGFTYAQQSDEF